MRIYAVRDASQSLSHIGVEPLAGADAAERLRANRVQAELVYTDSYARGSANDQSVWLIAEAYQSGRTAGLRDANFGEAYEGATPETAFSCEVPAHFAGADAEDYSRGHAEGVTAFWASYK
jgi:hypothetical protein